MAPGVSVRERRFVHVEYDDILKIDAAGLMCCDEVSIDDVYRRQFIESCLWKRGASNRRGWSFSSSGTPRSCIQDDHQVTPLLTTTSLPCLAPSCTTHLVAGHMMTECLHTCSKSLVRLRALL